MTNSIATMKAVRLEKYGEPGVIQYAEIERPTPGEGELLIKVFASSVNPIDWKIVRGYLDGVVKPPMTLGWDVAGTVEAIGAGVKDFAVGESVYGMIPMRGGAFAEYAVVSSAEISRKPANLTYEQAAAIPAVTLTAWQALFRIAKLTAGQRVLIHGAAGGVGSMAVQLAHNAGAQVIATASTGSSDLVRSLGADEVIDYTAARFEQVIEAVDVVFDTVGGETLERSYTVVKPGGILVTIAEQPDPAKANNYNIQAVRLGVQPNPAELAQITEQIEAGKLIPIINRTFPLKEARQALELSLSGHARGKIILKVAEK